MRKIAVFLIDVYKNTLSKLFEVVFGHACRYTPTCSEYAKDAINKHGLISGGNLLIKRILKCHPFSKHEHFDPVPKKVHY